MLRPNLMFDLITIISSEALNKVRQTAQITHRPQNSIPGPKFKEVGWWNTYGEGSLNW
jgi:hypothetical protein